MFPGPAEMKGKLMGGFVVVVVTAAALTVSVRLMMWKFFVFPVNLFRRAATASLGLKTRTKNTHKQINNRSTKHKQIKNGEK